MKLVRLLTVGLLAGLPSLAFAQDGAPKPALDLQLDEYSLSLRDYTFPSGLRILFQEDHTQPIVGVTSVIDKGSSDDPVGKEGMAHLIEHLWFRSVHGVDSPKVWDILKELGANLNAYTANDVTAYQTVVPSASLEAVLKLESLRLQGATAVSGVVESDVDTEREIVRNELRMRYENSDGSALWYLWDKLYPEGHPYSRLGIGTHDSLNSITMADVESWVDDNYRPENTTIVVVGDFNIDDSVSLIQQAFPIELLQDPENPDADLELIDPPIRVEELPLTADAQWKTMDPIPPVSREVTYHKGRVEQTTAIMAWSMPGGHRWDEPLMDIAARFLSFAVSQGLADDNVDVGPGGAGCFLWANEHASSVLCFIEVPRGYDPEDVIESAADGLYYMWDINQRYWQEGSFGQAKMQFMADIFRTVEVVSSLSGRATATAEFAHFTGDPMYFSRQFEWLNQVESYDASQMAQKWLTRDRFVSLVMEPFGDEDEITMDSSDAVYKGESREPEVNTIIDIENLTSDMVREVTLAPDLSDMQQFTLDNGMDVILFDYGNAPVAQVGVYFGGGSLTEPTPGITRYMNRYLDVELRPDADPLRIAGSWTLSYGSRGQYVGLTGSSANLDAQIWMVREYLDSMKIDVQSQRKYIKDSKSSLRGRRYDPVYWQDLVAYQRLFPDHPIGYRLDEATINAMAEFTQDDAEAWMRQIYQPSNATLYVIGRIDDRAAIESHIQTYFGDWVVKGAGTPAGEATPPPPPAPPERQVVVLDKPKKSQTDVTLYCQIGPAELENMEARRVLSSVLDEMAWVALRESAGVTYGAGSGDGEWPGGSAMLYFGSLVQNDAAGLAVDTFFKATEKAKAGDLDEKLINLMKLKNGRGYVLGHQTTGQMLGRLQSVESSGHGWELIDGHADRLAEVTLADLQTQMEPCTGHEIITLVGPKEQIVPQLEALDYPFEVFDWEAEAEALWMEDDPKGYAKSQKKKAKDEAKRAKKEAKNKDNEESEGAEDAEGAEE